MSSPSLVSVPYAVAPPAVASTATTRTVPNKRSRTGSEACSSSRGATQYYSDSGDLFNRDHGYELTGGLPWNTPVSNVAVTDTTAYQLRSQNIILSESDIEIPYVLKVCDLDDQDRPREKLLAHGPVELSVAEILAILLGVGTRREEVLVMAHRILKEYGERALIHETNPKILSESLGIPIGKACQLVASFELGRRFYQNRGGKPVVVRTARQAFEHLRGMGDLQKEQLRALYLGSRYQVVYEEVVSIGSLTANIVHPREVFQPAILHGAVAVIVAHNHPSGTLDPTDADIEVTSQLIEGGKLLGIELLDHLIIANKSYLSMMEDRATETE